ncbi:hypothetical protein [Methanofollis fontis]|uniref:Uncharacterized protein n=1 Tax=Methanofollis fontis TaxID=2052832 RepID=A0A483CM43_9EURY|nr:hypothetical protein [Methanofollis fontis]TAJ44059.1 hypothetical protein CUJ86_08465 [Methanofollis fontis]
MGTITAQILVGSPHPYHDGLMPTHQVFLSENSRPAWVLTRPGLAPPLHTRPPRGEEGPRRHPHRRITWIPGGPGHILEDALVMIAYHVIRDPGVVALADDSIGGIGGERLSLDAASDDCLEEIRGRCRQVENWPKLILSAFQGSSVLSQLPVIERYPMEVEVCSPSFVRRYGRDGSVETVGRTG